jgi:hypothetical protein
LPHIAWNSNQRGCRWRWFDQRGNQRFRSDSRTHDRDRVFSDLAVVIDDGIQKRMPRRVKPFHSVQQLFE